MRLFASTVAAIALFGGVTAAYATVTGGTIQKVSPSRDMVTLDNGTTYSIPKKVKLSALKVGEKVRLNYTYEHGKIRRFVDQARDVTIDARNALSPVAGEGLLTAP